MKVKLRKKVKDSWRAAGEARGKGVEKDIRVATAYGAGPRGIAAVATERVKTSIIIERKLMKEAQELARVMGISYNGFINMAIYEKLRALDSDGSRRPPASRAPEVQVALQRKPRATDPSPSPHSSGYTLPSEEPGADADFADWPTVERYAKLQLKHPHDNFLKMARRMHILPGTARAADIAQESEEYRRYLKRKAKAS